MSHTTNGLIMQCTRATNSIDPSIEFRLGDDSIEVFTLTHALHNDRRRLVTNLERFRICNHDWGLNATTPQCQAEHALEIRSQSDCHSTMSGGRRHAIEHGFESPKHRVSLELWMNSYVHRRHYKQAQMKQVFHTKQSNICTLKYLKPGTHETKQMMRYQSSMRQRSSLIFGRRLAPSPFVKLSAAMSEVDWYVNLIPLLDIWCSHKALTLM